MIINNLYKVLLPAVVFQNIVIAGGYGTGQEFNQFFLSHGAATGFIALLFSGIIWSLVCACSYRFALIHQAFDYKSYFKSLLGKYSTLCEIIYISLIAIVLAVVTASIADLGHVSLGLAPDVAILLAFFVILGLLYMGNSFIEKIFSYWTIFLLGVYVALFSYILATKYSIISSSLDFENYSASKALVQSLTYAGYNLGLIPAVFYALRNLSTPRQALISGLLSGLFAILPGILFYLCMLGFYPEILQQKLPSMYILYKINLSFFNLAFPVVLLGTLIHTTTGLIQTFNIRLANAGVKTKHYLGINLLILTSLFCGSKFGLVNLINYGYGTVAWLIVFLFIVPIIGRSLIDN